MFGEKTVSSEACCDKPCLVRDWDAGRYGSKCTNCGTFRED